MSKSLARGMNDWSECGMRGSCGPVRNESSSDRDVAALEYQMTEVSPRARNASSSCSHAYRPSDCSGSKQTWSIFGSAIAKASFLASVPVLLVHRSEER